MSRTRKTAKSSSFRTSITEVSYDAYLTAIARPGDVTPVEWFRLAKALQAQARRCNAGTLDHAGLTESAADCMVRAAEAKVLGQ